MFELHHLRTESRIHYQLGFRQIVRFINYIKIELFDELSENPSYQQVVLFF